MKLLGINELCALTGQAQKTVTQRLNASGLEPVNGPRQSKQFESDQALAVLLCGGLRLDPGQEKARLDKTRREVAELVLAEKRGELVNREEVLQTWQQVLASVRAKFLALPTKGASLSMSARSLPEAEDVLRRLVTEALGELAVTNGLPGTGSANATAGPDGKPVGGPEPDAKSRGKRRAGDVADEPSGVPARDHGRGGRPKRPADRGDDLGAGRQV